MHDLVAPIVAAEGLDLYDVEHNGSVLRILVDTEDGVEVGDIQRVSRAVSRMLDDTDPIPGRYTLEVSSPGLERPLRTVDHYRAALGSKVTIKLGPHIEGERRLTGVLRSVDPDGFDLDLDGSSHRISLADVTKARTVFTWGPTPKRSGRQTAAADKTDSQREARTP